MQRTMFLVGAAVMLSAFGFACAPIGLSEAPVPVAGAASGPSARIMADMPCPDGKTFIKDNVFELAAQYDHEHNGACPGGASCSFPQPGAASNYNTLIQSAFNIATPDLQARLCGLDKIYVDQFDTDHSVWGIRDRSSRARHIGMSKQLLNDVTNTGTWPSPYASYETEILHHLLWPTASAQPTWLQQASYTVSSDSPQVAVLAIMAHEVGHTIWWHRGIPNLECSRVTFHEGTWNEPIGTPRGYHLFGVEQLRTNGKKNHSIEKFDKDDMVALLNRGSVSDPGGVAALHQLSTDMDTVYGDGNWANLFSFVDPDEDFIETYKFLNLQNAGVGIDLQFPNASGTGQETVHVMNNFANASSGSGLGQKIAWINQWLAGSCSGPRRH